eukprot:Seg2437.3 transcript_id=Seg2437.3/GoldUCD/mRNA.D3Y31 product="hypothetical protein" protein_id=Seg2437.3/GoldUCD/D3Y31
MAAKFEEIQGSKSTTTDARYGTDYSAHKTIKVNYKHPKGLKFSCTHKDCKDYEDAAREELIEIGNKSIKYHHDRGNYFIMELITLYSNMNQIATASLEYGVVDAEKTSAENKEAGKKFLEDLAQDFEMSEQQFLNTCCETFGIHKKLFGALIQ